MGAPGEVALLELGPGHGTLMVDALRTASRVQGFADALELHLYDSHADLRARQAETLVGFNPRWTEDIVPQGDLPLIVVANEFFDALPIRQFVKSGMNWHERVIGLSEGQRRFGLDPVPVPETSLPKPLHGATDGSVFETSPAAANIMSELATAIATRGGAILAIDYGYHHTRAGETLQAVRHHAYADPLADPGNVDLSAHVDFSVLGNEAARAGLTVQPLAMQSDFLARLGIHRRAQNLAQASPADADEIAAATARLTAADAMGTLFKVFCAASPGLLPPGFQV
jgi:SAM-dependent MidA family methyltransferase